MYVGFFYLDSDVSTAAAAKGIITPPATTTCMQIFKLVTVGSNNRIEKNVHTKKSLLKPERKI